MARRRTAAYRTLGQYGEIGGVRRFWVPCSLFASPLARGERTKVRGSSPPGGTNRWSNPHRSPFVGPAHSFALKRKNHLPIVLHADDSPAVLLCFIVEGLSESADLRIGKPFSGPVGVFPLGVIVQDEQ